MRHFFNQLTSFLFNMPNLIIFILVILMLISLGYSLFVMVKDPSSSKRNVKGLTIRIIIWVVLFAFLFIGMKTGFIKPSNSLNKSVIMQNQQDKN